MPENTDETKATRNLQVPLPDTDDLLQSLKLYQVELETQNEQLRRAQMALEASRDSYINLYDFAPVSYLSLNAEGMIVEINLTGTKMLGVERDKIINQRFDRFVAENSKGSWYRHSLLIKQRVCKLSFELCLCRPDGTNFDALLDCNSVQITNSGSTMRMTLTNITERKQVESELHVSHMALKSITQGVLIADKKGLILSANNAFMSITGYSESDMVGKTCFFLQGPDTDTRTKEAIGQALKNHVEFSGEILNYRKDGIPFWNDLTISPVLNNNGQLTHYIGITRDITKRKLADEELRIAAAAFDTQAGIMVVNADKIILRVNKAFSEITGYDADDVIGKQPIIMCPDMHVYEFKRDPWAYVADKKFWQGETWEVRKNGDIFPAWLIVSAVFDTDNTITHYVISCLDITLQKQAQKLLLDARQRLENQVATTLVELENVKEENVETNSALKVLLKHKEIDNRDARTKLSEEVESTIFPLLNKLKKISGGRAESSGLVECLETNLQHLVQFYGRKSDLRSVYQRLSPVEAQVASMVRQGFSTKLIATTLSSSPETVNNHRKHIRKKLGLEKTTNLYSYLNSLVE